MLDFPQAPYFPDERLNSYKIRNYFASFLAASSSSMA